MYIDKVPNKDFKKIIALLLEYYKNERNKSWIKDIVEYSEFEFVEGTYRTIDNVYYKLKLRTEPKVFLKLFEFIKATKETLKKDIETLSDLIIESIEIKPNYERFEIIDSNIQPILTEWVEINRLQSDLIDNLKRSTTDIDARNIGNSSRIILEKLANQVFIPEKHMLNEDNIDTSAAKYKNRLHSFIKSELSGSHNKELRQFSESAINTVEKTINLSNNLTHNKKADKFLSEYCVIATISTISLIRMISNIN